MENIVIYGGGGFGRELACLINALNGVKKKWNLLGFIDDGLPVGTENDFGKVIGNMQVLNSFKDKIAVAISIASPPIISKITSEILNPNVWYPNLIAPDVKFHDPGSFKMGIGNILFFSCRISCNVVIGSYNLMNSLTSLGHDVVVGDRNVFNPAARVSGYSTIGNDNFIGMNSLIIQGVKIGNNTKIGVASVVIRNTTDCSLYFGNPAKKIRYQ